MAAAGTAGPMAGVELRSAAFHDNEMIPRRHSKDGEDISPPLTWSGVPEDTSELLLMCEDPDAPSGNFLHWLVAGIEPGTAGVEAGGSPAGGSARTNGFGDQGWGGPRPPAGDPPHRYFFRLYALSRAVDLPNGATPEDVHAAVDRIQLASGALVGLYQR